MFDIPGAKRVRRDDLNISDNDTEDTASLIDDTRAKLLQDRLAQLYEPIVLPPQNPAAPCSTWPSQDTPTAEAEDETFEFRLFRPPATTDASNANPSSTSALGFTQRIILSNSDDEYQGDGAFTVPHRRLDWYIAAPAIGARKAEFEDAAVSAEVVMQWKAQRAWALEKPWKVTVIGAGSKPIPRSAAVPAYLTTGRRADGRGDEKLKRTKLNKKRRILLRVRERAHAKKLEEERLRRAREEEGKAKRGVEEAEKRTARNREKKAKRKMREKRKKAAAAAGMPDRSRNESGSEGDVD